MTTTKAEAIAWFDKITEYSGKRFSTGTDTPSDDALAQEKLTIDLMIATQTRIDALSKTDAPYKDDADFKAKYATFTSLIATDKALYNKQSKTPYVYTEPAAEKLGQAFEDGGSNLGDQANKAAKGIGDWFSDCWSSIKNFFSGKKDGKPEVEEDELDEHGKPKLDEHGNHIKKKKGFFDGLNVGDMVGGLLGAIGGWLAGNIFGGGFVGKLLGGALALGGVFMGKEAFGKTINRWLGRSPSDDKDNNKNNYVANQPANTDQKKNDVNANTANNSANKQTPPPGFTPDEMRLMMKSYYIGYFGVAYDPAQNVSNDVQRANYGPPQSQLGNGNTRGT